MIKKYIEINSAFRDRNRFPFPGKFEIALSPTRTSSDAIDPITDTLPEIRFNQSLNLGSDPSSVLEGKINLATSSSNLGYISSNNTFIGELDANNIAKTSTNFYRGLVVVLVHDTVSYPRRIVSLTPLNDSATQVLIKIEGTLPDQIENVDSFSITSPIDLNASTGTPSVVFIHSGESHDNFYINRKLVHIDQTTGDEESRTIISYDSSTRLATVDSPFSDNTTWLEWVIRKSEPRFKGYVDTFTATTATLSQATILGNSFNTRSDFYKGFFVRFIQNVSADSGELGQESIYRITSSEINGNDLDVTLVKTDYTTSETFDNLDFYEILPVVRDNVQPLSYNGTMVSSQQLVCYEIELISLIIPNTLLSVGRGCRIPYYPYVYVEFTNLSSANNSNLIYSNNPNSRRMMFRASINDTNQPVNSSFTRLDGNKMVQTAKFKPNDNFLFSVHLPNGEIYKTIIEDTTSPYPPNPLGQISACFSIKRMK